MQNFKPGLLALLLFGAVLQAAASSPHVSELEKALAAAAPAEKSGLLVNLSAAIEPDDLERAWTYAQQARREARTPRDDSRAAGRIFALQRQRGNSEDALPALERRVATVPADEKSAALLALSVTVEAFDMARARLAAQQARDSATNPRDEMLADARLATVLRRQGDYTTAFNLLRSALDRATTLRDAVARIPVLYAYAQISWSLSDYPTSMESYQELLQLAEKQGDRYHEGRSHLGLGVLYSENQEKPRARAEAESALRIFTETGDEESQADALNNLGNNLRSTGEFDRAGDAHERALAIRTKLGHRRAMADSLVNLGEVARVRGDFAAALDYTRRAFALYEKLGMKRYLANTHIQFAQILRATHRLDETLATLNTGFVYAEQLNSSTILANYHREFAAVHEARGDFRASLDSQRKFTAATTAAMGEKSRQRIDFLQVRFDSERRQHELDVLRRDHAAKELELTHVRNQRIGLVILLCLGIATLAALIRSQRIKRRAEQRVLAEATAARHTAEEADAFKSKLVGMVSHDIRGPLGNILAMGEELRDDSALETDDTRVQVIVHESRHVLGLAQDLLDAAALETGRLQLQSSPVDLADIARTALDRVSLLAGAKGQQLDFRKTSGAPTLVNGDVTRLTQATTNLLSNAIKYSPRNTAVRVSLVREQDRVRLAVQDEGPGIAAESVPELFRPFSRLSARPTGGESSHGLGLAITHDLIRLHGGDVTVDSTPGRGSTFTISLPALAGIPS